MGSKAHFNRFILASTSTLKSPLSPRPSLMPSLSRETASAIKLLMLTHCYDTHCTCDKRGNNDSSSEKFAFFTFFSVTSFWQQISIKVHVTFLLCFIRDFSKTHIRGWISIESACSVLSDCDGFK